MPEYSKESFAEALDRLCKYFGVSKNLAPLKTADEIIGVHEQRSRMIENARLNWTQFGNACETDLRPFLYRVDDQQIIHVTLPRVWDSIQTLVLNALQLLLVQRLPRVDVELLRAGPCRETSELVVRPCVGDSIFETLQTIDKAAHAVWLAHTARLR